MRSYPLQFNTAQIEAIWCTSALHHLQIPASVLMVSNNRGNNTVMPVRSVRDLDIYVISDLSMQTHIART